MKIIFQLVGVRWMELSWNYEFELSKIYNRAVMNGLVRTLYREFDSSLRLLHFNVMHSSSDY